MALSDDVQEFIDSKNDVKRDATLFDKIVNSPLGVDLTDKDGNPIDTMRQALEILKNGGYDFTNIPDPSDPLNPVNKSATWAFYSSDVTRRGVGTYMELAALDYAFLTLELNRLECEVLDFNEAVMKFHRKFGFSLEGTKRQAYFRDGVFYDIYSLSILKSDWLRSQDKSITAPKKVSQRQIMSQDIITAYADVIADHNFIHINEEKAKQAGFKSTIAHGMLSGSLFSSIFSKAPFDPGVVYMEQTLIFKKPLGSGTEVDVQINLVSQVGRKAIYETKILHADTVYLTGEATILLPKRH